jgi:4-hydroxymandelate oxidase
MTEATTAALVNVSDFEEAARRRLATPVYNYIAGAAGDEISLRRNRSAFDALLLKPRVLRDVSRLDTAVELFGVRQKAPILLAPTAYHRMVHPEGELATARGAAAAGATMVISSIATTTVEEIAATAGGALWFQLYVLPDRAFTRDLVQRAEAAGCRALCITVDTPVLGTRNREMRDRFGLPPGLDRANLRGLEGARAGHFDAGGVYNEVLDPALTWDGIDWIRSFAKVPVVLKGILAPEDARLAVEHGVAGIIVSNHGARNLDTTPATIEALPAVAEAVAGRLTILLDGGVRRGTDVVKALALGARAVLVGRPYLWGLAAAGAEGVERVLELLRTELLAAMALCGRPNLASIDPTVLWTGGSWS